MNNFLFFYTQSAYVAASSWIKTTCQMDSLYSEEAFAVSFFSFLQTRDQVLLSEDFCEGFLSKANLLCEIEANTFLTEEKRQARDKTQKNLDIMWLEIKKKFPELHDHLFKKERLFVSLLISFQEWAKDNRWSPPSHTEERNMSQKEKTSLALLKESPLMTIPFFLLNSEKKNNP